VDGILNLNKPAGPTSFTAVSKVKHLLHERQVGHGGTLDPLASGVLPLFLGQSTRVAEYLLEYPKTYRAEVVLGITTDTYDAEGNITCRADATGIQREILEKELSAFRGVISQTPPIYSAIKHKGQPLHKLARRGDCITVESRQVNIYRLDLLDFQTPVVTLEIECSKGTYIRSLAYDLGQRLGCGAYLKNLIRTTYGPFDINKSITLPELEAAVENNAWQHLLHPADSVLSHWLAVTLTPEQIEAVKHGSAILLEDQSGGTRLRAYDGTGQLITLLGYDMGSGRWQPHKVFKAT
jgi:tRNA pseudouridine55 synthase